MKIKFDDKNKTQLILAIVAGVTAPILADFIKKQIKKRQESKNPKVDVNTDHSFKSWTGDESFLDASHDHFVNEKNSHMYIVPLSSKERMRDYPTFKKYSPFNISPSKKIKLT
jgi:hypothetical protein